MEFVDNLLNKRLVKVGRSSNLLWLIFDNSIIRDINKTKYIVGEEKYSLHVQCPWRIRTELNATIKLASNDMYEPNSKIKWSENFDWEPQGNNLFDEKIISLFPQDNIILVNKFFILENNDFRIVFSNELILECFIDVSTNQECWRFFKQDNNKHLVISGNIKEFQ